MGLERLLAGQLLCERYRVEELIGRGGMGAVYRARDTRLERGVALKVITAATAALGARQRLRERFHREARAAATLQHPNVVTVYDYGTDPRLDLDFLVMELLAGEDLASRLARGGRPEIGTALGILTQAAQGVAAGHRCGLIHRDIKPANLYLASEGSGGFRVRVLDFGIVQRATEADDPQTTMTQLTVVGRAPLSPAYAAPEQLRGESGLTPAVDVWGLGATAFHLLTGQRPFAEPEQRGMMEGASVPAPSARVVNAGVPAAVDEVLQIALAHRPADRFCDASDFAHAWADACNAAPGGVMQEQPAALRRSEGSRATPAESMARRQASRRWGSAPRWPAAPAPPDGESTLLAPLSAADNAFPARADASLTAMLAPPQQQEERGQLEVIAAKRGWLRRAAGAAWQATVTLISVAAVAAFAVGVFRAFTANLVEPFYASVLGMTLTIPWAVHRLFGRRGSYVLAMLGCVLASIAIFRLLAPLTDPVSALISLPVAQVVTAILIVKLTRRKTGGAHASREA
jgi:tRNA A-37 threonylcarbamoyl transferase component Bud32